MVIFKEKIYFDTSKRVEILDITMEVEKIVNESKLSNGIVNIYSKHSTSAIVVNENESGLLTDYEKILSHLVPQNNNYNHDIIDNNADSHLRSLLLGVSETIPFRENKLGLGTWQSIFFIELDGPRRKRTVEVTVFGE